MANGHDGHRAQRSPLFERLRGLDRPIVVAHRGRSSLHPENTAEAFAAAIDCGAEMIEFDVHTARDGAVVVIHDETLDRTTDIRQRSRRREVTVAGSTLAEIGQLDAGSWFGPEHAGARIPTLDATLEQLAGRVVPMIEHKGGDAASLLKVLESRRAIDAVVVQSFDWDFVREIGRLEPSLARGALGEGLLDATRLAQLDDLDVGLVHWNHQDLRLEDIGRLRDRGYLTCVYTANTPIELLGCVAAGLDAVTTNFPDRLLEIRRLRAR